MRLLSLTLVAFAFALPARAADNSPNPDRGNESLGGKLLDDLGPIAPAAEATPQRGVAPRTAQPPTGAHSPTASTPGHTASPAPVAGMVPLARVEQGMQNAEYLLSQPGTRSGSVKLAGSVQQDVVSELDQLIAELSKQCQCQCQGQCNKPSDKQSSQPKPGNKPSMAAGKGSAPARESTDRLDRTNAQTPDKGEVSNMVKDLWGHLPERSREQMLQSFSDEFLPKYEQEIEQYYRRLSDEEAKRSDSRPASNK